MMSIAHFVQWQRVFACPGPSLSRNSLWMATSSSPDHHGTKVSPSVLWLTHRTTFCNANPCLDRVWCFQKEFKDVALVHTTKAHCWLFLATVEKDLCNEAGLILCHISQIKKCTKISADNKNIGSNLWPRIISCFSLFLDLLWGSILLVLKYRYSVDMSPDLPTGLWVWVLKFWWEYVLYAFEMISLPFCFYSFCFEEELNAFFFSTVIL